MVGNPRARFSPDSPCRNCGDGTVGNYCPTCGQAKRDVRVSVGALVADLLEDQLVLSRALPSTLSSLLLRPGQLTQEYMAGRIVRYIAPFRLYLASSVLFFLLFSLLGVRAVFTSPEEDEAANPPAAATPDSTSAPAPDTLQSWVRNLQISIGSEETSRRVRQRVIERFGRMTLPRAAREVLGEYARYVPHLIFLLLPLFAGLLKILYLRSGRYYAEHFVFSLHVHAFVFVALSLTVVVRWLPALAVVAAVVVVYVCSAMKRVYGQGWLATGLKAVVLGATYQAAVLLGLAMTFGYTLLKL